ncbi:MAG TPA: ATPase, T2SS/T4P/T4SS family [Planctomycetaceae bacterium]|nr:ATPase, T2SS/T4P/T4SS family [Planctomycetaceae bacterium]
MVFGFFRKKEEEVEEIEVEPVSFLGPLSGQEVNLKANSRLVDAGLLRAKDLVTDALARRADTIRIEPKGPQAIITLLIDGFPYPGGKLSKPEGLAITQMLKLLAGLDIKQRKAPQSGGIKADFDSKPFVLNVSSVPVPEGERLLVRVTNQSLKLEAANEIGMGEDLRQKLRGICTATGLLVVAGPPGSGTTTTMFALVRNVDAYIYTIFTLADLGGRKLNQTTPLEAEPGDDLTATITRAVRKEANVVLCEPLADGDSLKMMLAKTEDVMLLSEMTAKDVASALLQLVAWSGDAQRLAAGLQGIVTQKLIRLLCTDCRQMYRPKADLLRKLGLPEDLTALYRKPPQSSDPNAETCEKCGGIGYYGRTGMFEFLEMSDGMKELIAEQPDANSIRAQMKKDKMLTLQRDGLRLVAEGRTSLEELQRVFKA